jgi:hypothetical protein
LSEAHNSIRNQLPNPSTAFEKANQQTSYILQVFGYWDMVCAFVLHGALTEGLVYDTCQEMYFQWVKIQPYIKTFRRELNLPSGCRASKR